MTIESKSYHNIAYKTFLGLLGVLFLILVIAIPDTILTKIEESSHFMQGKYIWNLFHILAMLLAVVLVFSFLNQNSISRHLTKAETLFDYTLITEFTENHVSFQKPKKKITLAYSDIQDVIVWPVLFGRGEINPMSYKLIIKTKNRTYKIYSEILSQAEYHLFKETELYKVYLELKSHRVVRV